MRSSYRQPSLGEGAAERSEAGLAFFFAAKPPPLCLSHRGRETASAVDRALSFIACLRRSSSLFFIPLVPYPARSARHLPHAGKALSVDIVFSTYAYIRSDNARKAVFSYHSLPHWGRGTASAVDRVLSQAAYLRRSPPLFFIPLEPYPARSARHLPHAGKALCREKRYPHIAALCFPHSG